MAETSCRCSKINWDATFDVNNGMIGVRVIIRNYKGQFVGALRAGRSLTQNSFVAETMALFFAVKLCKDLEIHHILLEGDTIQVINLMKKKSIDWSEGWLLV